MREDRRNRKWSASAAGVALLFVISGAAGAQSASPSPSESVEPSASAAATASIDPSAAPTASAAPSPSPSASPVFDCSTAFANAEDFNVLRGATVWVQIRGFPANAPATIHFESMADVFEQPMGAATTDEHGNADVAVVIPMDAPFGDAFLLVTGTQGCRSDVYIVVVGSQEAISIDDHTVVRGQRVTIRAGGFAPESDVALFLDGDSRDALCRCRLLAEARTSASGHVVLILRIPRDVSAGGHWLTLNGTSFDQDHDLGLSVRITVLDVGTMPSTDMA